MNLIDRFTRDRVSRVVWGLCLIVALGLLALAVIEGRRAVDAEHAASEARAAGYATGVVEPTIAELALDQPIEGEANEELTSAVTDGILIDQRVAYVRLWAPDGRLLFSTDAAYPPGSNEALNGTELTQAIEGGRPITTSERSDAEAPVGVRELITYVPVDSAAGIPGVVEVVQDLDATVGAVGGDWFRLQLLAGLLVVSFLVLTILSFRDPTARIGAGVSFSADGVPPGYALIDEERLRAVNDVYELAQERVDRLKERLLMAEHARLATEGELQRVLSRFETPKRATGVGSLPTIAPVAVQPEVKALEPTDAFVETELVVDEPEPVAEVESPASLAREPEPEFEAEPEAAEPELEAVVEPEPEPEPILIPEPASEPAVVAPTTDFVDPLIPELADLEDDDEDDAVIARELLLRLMEAEVPMADSGVDPGEVRQRLVKMAASKRPGGGERRPVEAEEEPTRSQSRWARNR